MVHTNLKSSIHQVMHLMVSPSTIGKQEFLYLETRFGKLLEEEGCKTFSDFYHRAKMDSHKLLEKKIIDAITTNETLFFRDTSPFDLLKHKILPEIIDARSGNGSTPAATGLKIWSSACSTGQEIYSIAIVLKELLGNNGRYPVSLMGSDLSDAAITQASAGVYNKFEIERGLPREKLQRYFTCRRQLEDHLRLAVDVGAHLGRTGQGAGGHVVADQVDGEVVQAIGGRVDPALAVGCIGL